MTKSVRIENADTSKYKVVVEVWQKQQKYDASIQPIGEPVDVKVKEIPLDYPTFMATEYIHSTQWLVVREDGERKD